MGQAAELLEESLTKRRIPTRRSPSWPRLGQRAGAAGAEKRGRFLRSRGVVTLKRKPGHNGRVFSLRREERSSALAALTALATLAALTGLLLLAGLLPPPPAGRPDRAPAAAGRASARRRLADRPDRALLLLAGLLPAALLTALLAAVVLLATLVRIIHLAHRSVRLPLTITHVVGKVRTRGSRRRTRSRIQYKQNQQG